jgi:HEPN domain-containing protein
MKDLAEQLLKERNYGSAILHAQMCVELSLKALFDLLEIEYEKKHSIDAQSLEKALEKIGAKNQRRFRKRGA